jgi:septal ring factor EnvC (AmiA/AmiB activator)
MPAEMLAHPGITGRLNFSSSFHSLVNWLRPARQRAKDDSARTTVDLAESPTVAASSSEDDQSVVATLTARMETLEADFARVEAAAAMHRADFERERERCERLMAEVLKATGELMAAREAAARIAGELAALQARPWWRRLAG